MKPYSVIEVLRFVSILYKNIEAKVRNIIGKPTMRAPRDGLTKSTNDSNFTKIIIAAIQVPCAILQIFNHNRTKSNQIVTKNSRLLKKKWSLVRDAYFKVKWLLFKLNLFFLNVFLFFQAKPSNYEIEVSPIVI